MSLLLTILSCLFVGLVIELKRWHWHWLGYWVRFLVIAYAIYRIGEWFYVNLGC